MHSIGKRAGLGAVHPHVLRAVFNMAALDAGVPLRDVQIAARHADPRTTTTYDRRRQNFDRHAAYVVVAFVVGGLSRRGQRLSFAIRYCDLEIFASARKHGTADEDIDHAVDHALTIGEQGDGKVLYLGPDRAGNLLEVVSVIRDDGTEIVIHAMPMRAKYEPFLRGEGANDA